MKSESKLHGRERGKDTFRIVLCRKMHDGQFRKSGEPYIIHPCAVAEILIDLGFDEATIMAALLHDVIEDTPATDDDIKKNFGDEVLYLVEGVTKLDKLKFENVEEEQAENLRKMFLPWQKTIESSS